MAKNYTRWIFGFEERLKMYAEEGYKILLDANIFNYDMGHDTSLGDKLLCLPYPDDLKEGITIELHYLTILNNFVKLYENIISSNLVLEEVGDHVSFLKWVYRLLKSGRLPLDDGADCHPLRKWEGEERAHELKKLHKITRDRTKRIGNQERQTVKGLKSILNKYKSMLLILYGREKQTLPVFDRKFAELKKELFSYEDLLGHENGKSTDIDIDLLARGLYLTFHGEDTVLFSQDKGIKSVVCEFVKQRGSYLLKDKKFIATKLHKNSVNEPKKPGFVW